MKQYLKILCGATIIFASLHALAERERLALVIGNADYQQGKLANPINDARAIAATLQQLGFKVTKLENADQEQMETAVRNFGQALNANTVGLFYFSGHGVQHNGQNYLIPINAMSQVNTADQLRYKTVNAGYILDTMKQSGSGLNLFFLDACRNTPFKSFSRSVNKGLARITGAEGTLIAYATAPGTVAYDGHGQNSPYTKNLLYWMRQPDIPIELALKKVRAGVKKETANKQSPWYEASIDGDFYFNGTGKDIAVAEPVIEVIPNNQIGPPVHQQPIKPSNNQNQSNCGGNFSGASISGSNIGNINISCN